MFVRLVPKRSSHWPRMKRDVSFSKLEAPRALRDGYELEEHAETCAALVATGDLFLKHGMVPEDLQEGLNQPQAVEVIDDDEALVMGPGFGGGGFINSVD